MIGRSSADLDPAAHDLLTCSLAWLDGQWDAAAGLVLAPSGSIYEQPYAGGTAHLVRESAQYALGLLMRRAPGDVARARQALDAVLRQQFDVPGQPYHGTWRRAPEEPAPPPNPRQWEDYDPNWREFIGTALALALIEYAELLPGDLIARIDASLRLAIQGTLARSISADYTNIALMCVFLLHYGGERFNEPGWLRHAEELAAEIHRRFATNTAFPEYNSPTYYAVDLYALALWRHYAAAPLLRELGAAMEASLWRDIARFYHIGLHNLCGPYDRSYGMDMRRYVAGLGMWIWLAVGRAHAPFPDLEQPLEHAWDFAAAATYVLPGARIPADALSHFSAFTGERQFERVIATAPRRVASAWLGAGVMLGAEDAAGQRPASGQFHPATLHWRDPLGQVCWLRARSGAPLDAWATRGRLEIVCAARNTQPITFEIDAPALDLAAIQAGRWQLPGLTIAVTTSTVLASATRTGGLVEVRYASHELATGMPTRFMLQLEETP